MQATIPARRKEIISSPLARSTVSAASKPGILYFWLPEDTDRKIVKDQKVFKIHISYLCKSTQK